MNAPADLRLNDDYLRFLEEKAELAPVGGYYVPLEEINPRLKMFTRLIVQWAFHGGRRAVFASFGLHKTVKQVNGVRVDDMTPQDRAALVDVSPFWRGDK